MNFAVEKNINKYNKDIQAHKKNSNNWIKDHF